MANPLLPPQNNPLMNPLMPPPPPSPSLGFQAWASDAQNAHKVMPSMTAPDAKLQPNASANPPQTMASAAPPNFAQSRASAQPTEPNAPLNMPDASAPSMPSAQPAVQSQLGADQSELQRLQKNGAGINQVKNSWLRGLGKVADIAGTILAPGVMSALPGTTVHNWGLQKQQAGRVAQDESAMDSAQKTQQFGMQQQLDTANLAHTQAETDKLQAPAADAADKFSIQSTDQGLLRIDSTTGEAKLITDASGKPYGPVDRPGTVHETMSGLVMVNSKGEATPVMDPKTGKQLQGNLQKPPTVNMNMLAPGSTDELVKGIGEGRIEPPNTRTAQGASIMARVAAAYPGFDASTFSAQKKMRETATSGKLGGSINSLNTINEHLDSAEKNMPKNGGIPFINSMTNAASRGMGGTPTTQFDVDADAIGGEWSKMVSGGVATQGELDHIKALLHSNGSPEQMKAGLAEVRSLTLGKLQGIQQQIGSGALPSSTPTRPISSVPGNPLAPPKQAGKPEVWTRDSSGKLVRQ